MKDKFPITTFAYHGHEIKMAGAHDNEYIFSIIRNTNQFYENDLLDLVSRIPIESGSIVDAGANIGNHTVFFSKVMGRKTHAFEVLPSTIQICVAAVSPIVSVTSTATRVLSGETRGRR